MKKLGLDNARKVLKILSDDPQHFGFINVSEEELADLTTMYSPNKMARSAGDVYSFRAASCFVLIVVHSLYIEVTLVSQYAQGNFTNCN